MTALYQRADEQQAASACRAVSGWPLNFASRARCWSPARPA